jgi:hypothetical protein
MSSKINLLILFSSASIFCFSQENTDSSKTKRNSVVFINGKPVSDTLRLSGFERIDYIKGKQAIELMGPRGKDGVYLVSSDGKIPVYGEVMTVGGSKIRNAEVISGDGNVLTKTNKCGTFFIPFFNLYNKLIIKKNGFVDYSIEIGKTEVLIKLVKK